MLKNVFAIKDCNAIVIDKIVKVANPADVTEKATFLSILKDNGYILSEEGLKSLFIYDVYSENLNTILCAVRNIKGSDVKHSMIISSFPNFEESQMTKIFGSFYNYITNGHGIGLDYASMPLDKRVKYEVLDVVDMDTIDEKIKTLFLSKLPLKLDHESLLADLYSDDDVLLKSINHKEIVLKEILARHIVYGLQNGHVGIARSATDILRAIALISGEDDAKLDSKFKIKSLSNPMRRVVVQELNRVATIEDVTGHKEMFKHLFKMLHVHDSKYSDFSSNISAIASKLQEVNNPRTEKTILHGLVAYGLDGYSDQLISEFVSSNVSWFARSLDALIRKNPTRVNLLLSLLVENVDKIGTKIMMQLLGHFSGRNEDIVERAFSLKGLSGGVKIVGDKPLVALDEKLLDSIKDTLIIAMKKAYKKSDFYFENVLIAKELFKINVPANMSANDSSKSVSRGSRVDMEFDDIMRLFVHWKASVDLDLSALMIGENGQVVDVCSFYKTRSEHPYLNHSGDVRSAPNGGSEFVDIHMYKLPKEVRYIVMHVNSWSGQSCSDIDELFAGYMTRHAHDNGYVYEPKTVENKFTLTGDVKSITPFYVDVKTKELVWVDDKGDLGEANTAEQTVMFSRLLEIANKKRLTLGELVAMHADNVLSLDEFEAMTEDEKSKVKVFNKEFAFDITEINSNYI